MGRLIQPFLIIPGMPLFITLGFILQSIGFGGVGPAVGLAVLGMFACSLITWAGIVALSMTYGWFVLQISVVVVLLVSVAMGDMFR